MVILRVSPRAPKHTGTKMDPSSKARELVSKAVVEAQIMPQEVVVRQEFAITVK